METKFMNTENSKRNKPRNFVLNLWQRLDLRSSDKYLNLSENYTWKNIRKQYENNKLKIVSQTWKDEFELPDDSYSVLDIKDYIEDIIKKHETLTAIPPIHIYINRVKIKDGYKLELKLGKMKLFGI